MKFRVFILTLVFNKYSEGFLKQDSTNTVKSVADNEVRNNELDEHTIVTNNRLFPFVVAILMKSSFLSAGALIDSNWVLTAADSLFLLREAARFLRIRLGSINYKKDGTVLPVKFIVIHPKFDDDKPSYDLAMIRLAEPAVFSPTIQPIRLCNIKSLDDATHFIVPSWPNPKMSLDESEQKLQSMEMVYRRRTLSVTHLHFSDDEDCEESLSAIGVHNTDIIMCLDTAAMNDPCSRDIGGPVVLNGMLMGIVSSWSPSDCNNYQPGPTYVTFVSSPEIRTWIYTIISGHIWVMPYSNKKNK